MFTQLPAQYREKRALVQLLKWAYQFSPIVALDTAALNSSAATARGRTTTAKTIDDSRYCGINMDITGCARLFRGEPRLLARVQAGLRSKGIETRLAVAPTLGCAWAVSRYGRQTSTIIAADCKHSKAAIAQLPTAALRISEKNQQALHELNITRIQHLLDLSPKALRTRFDRELIMRLNQALGIEQEPLLAVPFIESLRVARTFDGAVTQFDTIKQCAELLLEQLVLQITERSQKLSRLIIEIKTLGAPTICKEVPLSLPSNERSHLSKLLHTHLERLSMGHGVESLALHAPATEQQKAYEESFVSSQEEQLAPKDIATHSELAKLLDSLYEQLGERNVLQMAPAESHIPEKTIRYISMADRLNNGHCNRQQARIAQADRPSMLFYQPREIRAMAVLPDTPPFWLKWQQQTYQIIAGIGPERIAPEWWGNRDALFETRDYFKVQLPNGLWLWIFRDLERSKWFLHGIWA